ncbi:aldo/keto reductase [Mesorhizobium sp. A623]
MQRTSLAPGYEISRVIRGGWQLSDSHGTLRGSDPVSDMVAFADAGITTFDCADIYTGVEEMIGDFRMHYRDIRGQDALERIKVHTKFVPDLDVLARIAKSDVEGVIDQSLRRLKMDRLDLVQFHWWDYQQPRWLETAGWLNELRKAGKIDKISGTNFDSRHVSDLFAAGIPITTMQVQYSLLDARPRKQMATLAATHGMSLLCYGTVAGGFLGDRWLGKSEPKDFENRSLTKYKLIIDDTGGWARFQSLLTTLRRVADRHGVDIATIASAFTLSQPAVAAVIVGARNCDHLTSNLAISSTTLTKQDQEEIAGVTAGARELEGDVYSLERDRSSKHGAIMKYNLNKGEA